MKVESVFKCNIRNMSGRVHGDRFGSPDPFCRQIVHKGHVRITLEQMGEMRSATVRETLNFFPSSNTNAS